MKRFGIYTIIAAFAVVSTGCATDEYGNRRPMTDTEKGVLIGAASGAVLGALIFGVLRNALAQIPGATFYDRMIVGVVVIVIVVMDQILVKRGA